MKFLAVIPLLFGCQTSDDKQVKVAATAVPHAEILEQIVPALEEKGINLKIVVVDDYNLPNRMLAEKEVDANFFQHRPFLELYQKEFGYDFVPLAAVHLEPMGIYSQKVKNLQDVEAGNVVAIPADPTNQARALALLEKAGFITMGRHDVAASVRDIRENKRKLKFLEVDSAFLARTMHDVALAVITANFAMEAGLNPNKDALLLEDSDSAFVNLFVVRREDADKAEMVAIKQALQSSKTRAFIEQRYKGAIKPAF
jgi:D-methionine transport system substrate-binding protein